MWQSGIKRVWFQAMGAQNTKERNVSVGSHSTRTAKYRPRPTKDGRQIVSSNIFTEHSGKKLWIILLSILFTGMFINKTIPWIISIHESQ